MKILFRCFAVCACLCALTVPALADEKNNDYEKDARYAEGTPPMAPHRIDDKTSASCLGCHGTGANGAPISPHPIRLDCTQCHGQGDIKDKKSDSKKEKKSTIKSKEKRKE
jgi:cytochrome c-type protein NapB